MPKFNNPLDNVKIAAPCSADWNEMVGTEQKRFCGLCQLNVYNLSAMNKSEAEKLLSQNTDRLCVRFYRRADGTILTENCPTGLRAVKRRAKNLVTAVFSTIIGFATGIGFYNFAAPTRTSETGLVAAAPPVESNIDAPELTEFDSSPALMGGIGVYEEGMVSLPQKPKPFQPKNRRR